MTVNDKNLDLPEGGLKSKLRQAFAVGEEYEEKLLEDEDELLADIAERVHRRRLTAAAIPFLICNRPLNVLGANVLQMGELLFKQAPVEAFLKQFLGPKYHHDLLVRTLEKRCAIDRLIELLEAQTDKRPGEESS